MRICFGLSDLVDDSMRRPAVQHSWCSDGRDSSADASWGDRFPISGHLEAGRLVSTPAAICSPQDQHGARDQHADDNDLAKSCLVEIAVELQSEPGSGEKHRQSKQEQARGFRGPRALKADPE